ncbi:unnamed protein product [Protopolystoma xenopodis]|uniref:Uncharacterized protein n=1 Tax=Protopolystoma xenopodis TaxID=117903 RepID=A0A448XBV8_9PLAT|nr:unnamed protein product [Protopolystoma xenopodis]
MVARWQPKGRLCLVTVPIVGSSKHGFYFSHWTVSVDDPYLQIPTFELAVIVLLGRGTYACKHTVQGPTLCPSKSHLSATLSPTIFC